MVLPAIAAIASTAANFLSNRSANRAQQENAQRQEQVQREFAQQGIQWKVEDAKRAGIHPIYALGAQTTSYSPVSIGTQATDFSGLAQAGQSIQNSIDKTRTDPQRQSAVVQTMQQAQLDGLRLDNDIKRADLASKLATNATRGPGMPTPGISGHFDGQGDAIKLDGNKIKLETRRDVSDPNSPAYIPGSGPGVMLYKNSTGGYSPVRPPELAESFENDWIGGLDWTIRNRLVPYFGGTRPYINGQPAEWSWDQQWYPKGTIGGGKNPGSRHWKGK